MSNIVKWQPMRDFLTMRESMDRLFDDLMGRSLSPLRDFSSLAIDMYETEDSVVVKTALPGIKPGDIQVSVTGDVLSIRGEVKEEEESKNKTYHVKERSYGVFSRSIGLPITVMADKANAEFENGILTLTLPKAIEVRPKTITVKTK